MDSTHAPEIEGRSSLATPNEPHNGNTTTDLIGNSIAHADQPTALGAPASAASADDTSRVAPDPQDESAQPPITKSQLKKLKRRAIWEERKEDRKRLRKDKRHEKQANKRAEMAAKIAEAEAAGLDPKAVLAAERKAEAANKPKPRVAPVTIIVDCDFEQYMAEKELVSLSNQLVRSYSENRKSSVQAHLVLCPWTGKLKERFETTLANHHKNWKGVRFVEGDFVQAGVEAYEHMKGPHGGKLVGALAPKDDLLPESAEVASTDHPPQAPPSAESSIVYLTSDSPHTLEVLEPYTSYVIGGIVDRNREKGLCYRRACERGLRTAKLPIGEYLVMASRQVLTTNQVIEIMLKWLECGDWSLAFQNVIPKRKGAIVKGEIGSQADPDEDPDEPGQDTHVDGDGTTEIHNAGGEESSEDRVTEPAPVAVASTGDSTLVNQSSEEPGIQE